MSICAYEPCSKEFTPHKHGQKYCTRQCHVLAGRQRVRDKKPKRFCIDCGADISHRKGAKRCDEHARKRKNLLTNRKNVEYRQDTAIDDIALAREGLPPLRPGWIKCSCGRRFKSWDVVKNQFCDHCHIKHGRLNTGALVRVG